MDQEELDRICEECLEPWNCEGPEKCNRIIDAKVERTLQQAAESHEDWYNRRVKEIFADLRQAAKVKGSWPKQ